MTTKEQIIRDSTTMFMKSGVKSIRMDDIASRLGVSKRTIYEMFGDREGLIMECFNYYHKRQSAVNQARLKGAKNIVDEFLILFDFWEKSWQNNVSFITDICRFYPSIYEKITQQQHTEGVEYLKNRLRAGVEDGIFIPGINFDFAAVLLTNSIYAIFNNPNSYDASNISLSDAFKYTAIYFFRGIATEQGIKVIDEIVSHRYRAVSI